MKIKNIYFLLIFFLISGLGYYSCKKSEISPNCWGKCKDATFYYRGNCASITGVVRFEDEKYYVTQDRIPEEFRKDSIKVCIRYKNLGSKILTSDCEMGEVLKIKCIQKK